LDKIRVGIVGCGDIARSHLEGYLKNSVQPVAFFDLRREAAEKLAAGLSGARVYSDCRSMMESGEIDAVSICSPPAFHEEAACLALEAGINLLCEKPLAHTVPSAARIVDTAKTSGKTLMTAYRHRFIPAIAKMRQLIGEGRVGPPVLFNNIFCGSAPQMSQKWFSKKDIAGGGSMLDTSSHSVDLFRFLVGEIVDQRALWNRRRSGG